jgi:hypothetical protein
MRTEKRLLAGLALIVVIAVVVAIVLLTNSPGTGRASGETSSAAGTATVRRRDLVETDTESGTVSYAGPRPPTTAASLGEPETGALGLGRSCSSPALS